MSEAVDPIAEGSVARGVYTTLKVVFGIVPIVAGLDKFTNILVDWSKYLAHPIAAILPFSPRAFMYIVGVIEIIAGLGVLATRWTRVFAVIVAIWLLGIAVDLLIAGFYDIAVRDVVMAISAFCLARLAAVVPAREARTRTVRTAAA
jgi:uncharacterized membrane protein YphA (DoxX/SURF4 family)